MYKVYMKPFLKWVGGKTQIITDVLFYFPKEINNYYEPFLGGGSVLLSVLSDPTIKVSGKLYASDINPYLIGLYKAVQSTPEELVGEVKTLISIYQSCPALKIGSKIKTVTDLNSAKSSKEAYYYWIRKQFNSLTDKTSLVASAMFLFLNKTCFRGMYREGPNGFNVPFGNYETPEIINRDEIIAISKLIEKVEFSCLSFINSISSTTQNDFVYLDPPYAPETVTSFVGYNKDGFSLEQHKSLFTLIKQLPCRFLMSNASVPLVTEEFKNYDIKTVLCKRSINAKNPASKTNEVLIRN